MKNETDMAREYLSSISKPEYREYISKQLAGDFAVFIAKKIKDLEGNAKISDPVLPQASSHVIGDYDKWHNPCKRCGRDPGKSSGGPGENRCWSCGEYLSRDFSERALKVARKW